MTPRSFRVSVVVPTHQRPDTLGRLLASLASQTFPRDRFEVVVVATEEDGARDIVDATRRATGLDVRCVSIPDDPYGGRSAAAKRNFGARMAAGEWLAFTDDDCVADPRWLAGAAPRLADPEVAAVEGAMVIPPPPRPTLTYRGMLRLARRGGYQTCNMFYRRGLFLDLGGFDESFPYYFEDTDLAWTFLDHGHPIAFEPEARVLHPVPGPAPWKLLADGKRAGLLPLLRRKHRERYRATGRRALRPTHWLYVAFHGGIVLGLLTGSGALVVAAGSSLVLLTGVHAFKLFRRAKVEPSELWITVLLLPVVPLVRLVQYARGSLALLLRGGAGASATRRASR